MNSKLFSYHLTAYLWAPIYHAFRIIYNATPIITTPITKQRSRNNGILVP